MYCFTLDMMEGTKPGFGVGHPLPDNKENPAIHPAVKRHPKFWPKRQAGNGVPTRLVEMALSLGLMGVDFDGELYSPPPTDPAFFREHEPLGQREPTAEVLDIRPISSGTVIDHVEGSGGGGGAAAAPAAPYMIEKIARLLALSSRGDIFRMGVVESRKRPGTRKGVMMIKERFLSEQELRLIATIAPGATVNDIRERRVARKRELYLPAIVEGLPDMTCTNHRCITRREYHEHVAPRATRIGGPSANVVKCYYCNNLMESAELF
jgi:aspartate carbamoyltransferase regulatory subunit